MKTLTEVTKDALELPSDQRFTLARILLDVSESDAPADAGVDEAWEQEIARRMATVEEGTAKYRSSADVFTELDRRFPG